MVILLQWFFYLSIHINPIIQPRSICIAIPLGINVKTCNGWKTKKGRISNILKLSRPRYCQWISNVRLCILIYMMRMWVLQFKTYETKLESYYKEHQEKLTKTSCICTRVLIHFHHWIEWGNARVNTLSQ